MDRPQNQPKIDQGNLRAGSPFSGVEPQPPLPFKARLLARLGVWLIRLFSLTLRWRYVDEEGTLRKLPQGPVIWVLWHNQIFVLYKVFTRFLFARRGGVLTSVSGDGDIIAAALMLYGVHPIRGSTSRRGTQALMMLSEWLRAGFDILIVPDGPRGPRYHMGPGAIKLAELERVPILPIRAEFSSSWRFSGWDRFRLPKPFSEVTVHVGAPIEISGDLDADAFEEARVRVAQVLNPHDETE